jgi:hypothetical protein
METRGEYDICHEIGFESKVKSRKVERNEVY